MKKINKILLVFVSFAILLTNCTKEDITISTDEEFWLKYNQTAIIQNGLEIKFNDVILDQRCPESWRCNNPGLATIELLLNEFNKVNMSYFYKGESVDTFDYHIEFISIKPQNNKKSNLPNRSYEIKLKVTQ